jgi:5-methylcytosine-specific restriction protein A
MLSIEGNLFLSAFQKGEYIRCKELIINQLDDTKYPNSATTKVKNLKLFPFRILFKLLLDNKSIKSEFISKSLVHITKYNDIKKIDDIKSFDISSSKYKKFNTWVINSLVDLKILVSSNKTISIHQDVIKHIEMLYKNVDYKDMFFDDATCTMNQEIAYKRTKRDPKLIIEVKQRDNFICTVNHTHKTFLSKSRNYVEGHHIIPMYQQKNYSFRLDDIDNIASLCPNCHREIHSADDKLPILTKLYRLNREYMKGHNIKLNDLCKMYLCIS